MSTTLRAMNPWRGTLRLPPLWTRWVLAAIVGVAVLAGIVIVTNQAGPEGIASESAVEAEINRIADISTTEDEAPHSATLSPGSAPAAALQRAIASDIRQRIAANQISGPLHGVTCIVSGASSAGRDPYRCTVHSAGTAFRILAVINESQRRLTWCKVDTPPKGEPAPEIPISASCRT
jgi:hypothetical protein